MNRRSGFIPVLLLSFFCLCINTISYSQSTSKTVIRGVVTDAKTGETIPMVSALLENTTVGTLTDENGRYSIVTNVPAYKIRFSFLGYETQTFIITPGKAQTINVSLRESAISLNEVVVKPKKSSYSNRNNPAVDLIEKVIANKSTNRMSSSDYLTYNRYEKIKLGLININEDFSRIKAFRDFSFVFDNKDTTRSDGRYNLPLYMKETAATYYFRKDPSAEKAVINGEKTINFGEYIDDKGVSSSFKYMFQDIDIYDNEIFFLTNKFLSPVAGTAPAFYKFFISDTSYVDTTRCIKLFFEPRNPADFMFHGFLYITCDSSYAIRKIDMSFNHAINIDWVNDVRIVQEFEDTGGHKWMLKNDDVLIDFELSPETPGMFGQRTVSYYDYSINKPIPDSLFMNTETGRQPELPERDAEYWDSVRIPPLSETEQRIYTVVDSVKNISSFRRQMDLVMLLTTDFLNTGSYEIGPVSSFYSYNPVEGSRVRFGFRTTPQFNRWLYLEPYAAYGFGDEKFKYGLTTTFSLTGTSIYQYPVKSVKLNYMYDTRIPGQNLQYSSGDNIFLSLRRGVNDKMYYNRTLRLEYLNEFESHLSTTFGYQFTRQAPGGNLFFYSDGMKEDPYLDISEVYLKLRYAPREEFYQGKMYRDPVPSANPVMQVEYAVGSPAFGNDYSYSRLEAEIRKRFYLSIVGYTDVSVNAGKVFGKVPYPLLFVHNANQTYSYQRYSYNMMNFLEFVSDEYVSLNIDHSFNGFFMNKVPLLKKLKLREVVTLKALYGGVSDINNPALSKGLYTFPADADGKPLTFTLEQKPYIEASVGFSNILRIFRVDLIKRFTYLDNPNVSSLGVRVQFRFDI